MSKLPYGRLRRTWVGGLKSVQPHVKDGSSVYRSRPSYTKSRTLIRQTQKQRGKQVLAGRSIWVHSGWVGLVDNSGPHNSLPERIERVGSLGDAGTVEEAVTMNDAHVKAIHYFIEHDDSVDYRDVAPLVYEDDLFRVKAEKVEVVFEPKNHYATEEEARSVVEGLVRRWEFEAALRVGSARFKLIYARVDIIDRNPPPRGVVLNPVTFHFRVSKAQARVTKVLTEYPGPPSGQALEPDDPDASYMLSRLDLYRQRREPLADVAYLCLTVLVDSASGIAGGKGGNRKLAANYYQIERKVLERVGELSSKKGGAVARKSEGRTVAFTREDTCFLEAAVTAFTRRVAERAAAPNGNLPVITMADLLKTSR